MTYKNKVYFLAALIAVLVLLYAGNILFNSDFGTRNASFAWLDSKAAERTTRVVVNTQSGGFELLTQNNMWFVSHNDNMYPARQLRVQDFLSILTTRSTWPVRSASASSHERFGLDNQASRVTIYSDNTVILDLLLGNDDYVRSETYFRLYAQNEVRSGDSNIRTYIDSQINNWYNLRLIPESENGQISLANVQRLSVINHEETQIFTRSNRGWLFSGIEIENLDVSALEGYIRIILNIEGDNFTDIVTHDDPVFDHNRIVLELGTGRIITIRIADSDESGRRFANVSGSRYIYSIPSWSANRLFREAESFEAQ